MPVNTSINFYYSSVRVINFGMHYNVCLILIPRNCQKAKICFHCLAVCVGYREKVSWQQCSELNFPQIRCHVIVEKWLIFSEHDDFSRNPEISWVNAWNRTYSLNFIRTPKKTGFLSLLFLSRTGIYRCKTRTTINLLLKKQPHQ